MPNHHPPYDDDCEGISDEDGLIRRIFPGWIVRDDKFPGGYRLSSQAFEDHRSTHTPCSVNVQRLALALAELTRRFPDHSVALIGAGLTRVHGQGICFWEAPDEPGHAYDSRQATTRAVRTARSGLLASPQDEPQTQAT